MLHCSASSSSPPCLKHYRFLAPPCLHHPPSPLPSPFTLQITDEAKVKLVEAYVSLRRGDSAPGSRTSYRITVRQLEALVRLSEALARLYCSSKVGGSAAKCDAMSSSYRTALAIEFSLPKPECLEVVTIWRCRVLWGPK